MTPSQKPKVKKKTVKRSPLKKVVKKTAKKKRIVPSRKTAATVSSAKPAASDTPQTPKRRGRPPKALQQARAMMMSPEPSQTVSSPTRRRGRPPKQIRVSSYEGLQNDVRKMETPPIEVWANQYADREYTVDLTIPEFTCVCPKTGLPDFAVVRIRYSPRKWCLELKSVKMYMISYRQVGIFHEHLVNRILDDLVKACQPRWMEVEAVMNPRGGITTRVSVSYPLKKSRGRPPAQS